MDAALHRESPQPHAQLCLTLKETYTTGTVLMGGFPLSHADFHHTMCWGLQLFLKSNPGWGREALTLEVSQIVVLCRRTGCTRFAVMGKTLQTCLVGCL